MVDKTKKLVITCVLCKEKISITPEELKAGKYYEQYIVRHGTDGSLTAMQGGSLCEKCLKLPMEKRILIKR
jgi:hypothetical protein